MKIIYLIIPLGLLSCSHKPKSQQLPDARCGIYNNAYEAEDAGAVCYKIKPKYPRSALDANIQGHVNFLIDVLEDGSVDNVRTIDGENIETFEYAAQKAVTKYKYKPFTDDLGKSIKKTDYNVRITFQIKELYRNQVKSIIKDHMSEYRNCHNNKYDKNSKLTGKIILQWDITEIGAVKNIKVVETALNNTQLENCVMASIQKIQFPPAEDDKMAVVKFPFVFKRNSIQVRD